MINTESSYREIYYEIKKVNDTCYDKFHYHLHGDINKYEKKLLFFEKKELALFAIEKIISKIVSKSIMSKDDSNDEVQFRRNMRSLSRLNRNILIRNYNKVNHYTQLVNNKKRKDVINNG